LGKHGFGVLTDIDVQATLRKRRSEEIVKLHEAA
jgi:uncharacterized protein (DUF302 family)